MTDNSSSYKQAKVGMNEFVRTGDPDRYPACI